MFKRKMKIKAFATTTFGQWSNIIPANDYKPDWWKKQPAKGPVVHDNYGGELPPLKTIKACPAIHTQFQAGYVITAPFDMTITTTSTNFNITLPHTIDTLPGHIGIDKTATFSSHARGQWSELNTDADYIPMTLKIDTGIQLLTNVPCNVMFIQPYWTHVERQQDLIVVPGTMQLSPDIYPCDIGHPVIPNYLVRKNRKIEIKRGDPLLQIIPFAQQHVELQEGIVDLETRSRIFAAMSIVFNSMVPRFGTNYKKLVKHLSFKNSYTKSKENADATKWYDSMMKGIAKFKGHDDSDFTK